MGKRLRVYYACNGFVISRAQQLPRRWNHFFSITFSSPASPSGSPNVDFSFFFLSFCFFLSPSYAHAPYFSFPVPIVRSCFSLPRSLPFFLSFVPVSHFLVLFLFFFLSPFYPFSFSSFSYFFSADFLSFSSSVPFPFLSSVIIHSVFENVLLYCAPRHLSLFLSLTLSLSLCIYSIYIYIYLYILNI